MLTSLLLLIDLKAHTLLKCTDYDSCKDHVIIILLLYLF